MTEKPQALTADTYDARNDPKWATHCEQLLAGNNWPALWEFAQRTPPIWSVRILKVLAKHNWRPDNAAELSRFEILCHHAAACNEHELPGPDIRQPRSVQIAPGPFSTARVTADGEYLFAIDATASCLYVYRLYDFSPVELIKIDVSSGKLYAPIAFAASEAGDKLAVMVHEPKAANTFIHLYWLNEGTVVKDRWIDLKIKNVGTQIPRLAFTPDGKYVASLTAAHVLSFVDCESRMQLLSFENQGDSSEKGMDLAERFAIQDGQSITDWRKYGVRCLTDAESRGLVVANDAFLIVAQRGLWALVWKEMEIVTATRKVRNSSGEMALSPDGKFLITIDQERVFVSDLLTGHRLDFVCTHPNEDAGHSTRYESSGEPELVKTITDIAHCDDPAARIAISAGSEFMAVSKSRSQIIRMWHLPDGRNLGTVHGLAEEDLAEFRFTSGGSLIAVTRKGLVQVWEADGNGNVWPWSKQLLRIVHQPVDSANISDLRGAEVVLRRGWLSSQEAAFLDLSFKLMEHQRKTENE